MDHFGDSYLIQS
jgi:hypothetical protein